MRRKDDLDYLVDDLLLKMWDDDFTYNNGASESQLRKILSKVLPEHLDLPEGFAK